MEPPLEPAPRQDGSLQDDASKEITTLETPPPPIRVARFEFSPGGPPWITKEHHDNASSEEIGTKAEATARSKATFKPQFIHVLPQDFIENMLIPAKFVQHYIFKEHLNNCTAVIFVPLGKIYQIELKMNQLGVFFAGGWPQFLSFHNITGPNTLLLRYEGNMVYTVKVFEPNGCLRGPNHKDIRMQQKSEQLQETPPSGQGEKRPNSSLTYLDHVKTECVYEIGPPAWVKKEVNTSTIGYRLALPAVFCNAIGLQASCLITLKISLCGARSWLVAITPHRRSSHRVTVGWKRFCRDNELKVGDVCTFNIVETRLWHVVIERC
ncbi:hypothetical protein EJB05_50914, partial [Eragrostis curvula]